tara:strand:+ start:251 stop:460 length:210 start_codon:yes stop_codon:yes gene_type:complete
MLVSVELTQRDNKAPQARPILNHNEKYGFQIAPQAKILKFAIQKCKFTIKIEHFALFPSQMGGKICSKS